MLWCPLFWKCYHNIWTFSFTCLQWTWTLHWVRYHKKGNNSELLDKPGDHRSDMWCVVCACWLANHSLSRTSWWHIDFLGRSQSRHSLSHRSTWHIGCFDSCWSRHSLSHKSWWHIDFLGSSQSVTHLGDTVISLAVLNLGTVCHKSWWRSDFFGSSQSRHSLSHTSWWHSDFFGSSI